MDRRLKKSWVFEKSYYESYLALVSKEGIRVGLTVGINVGLNVGLDVGLGEGLTVQVAIGSRVVVRGACVTVEARYWLPCRTRSRNFASRARLLAN